VRSAKELNELIKKMRIVMVKNSEPVYTRIYTKFMFATLLLAFYFYYLRDIKKFVPAVDTVLFWVCVSIASVQVILYWMYNNFRVIYYFYLMLYRGVHKRDLLEKEMKDFMILVSQEMEEAAKFTSE
jgi:hypothetical protein